MIFVPMAFGYLIGNPIAGIILGAGWIPLQIFCAASLAASLGLLVVLKIKLIS